MRGWTPEPTSKSRRTGTASDVARFLPAPAIDGGFQHSSFRRIILLLTTGMEGDSRIGEREVLRLARRNSVSIFPVYLAGIERSMFETLARQTGGASFNLRDLKRNVSGPPGPRIFEVMRSHYTLTLTSNLALGEKLKVEVRVRGSCWSRPFRSNNRAGAAFGDFPRELRPFELRIQ